MKMKKIEWIILAAVVAVCAGLALFFYWPRSGDTVAVVSVDGTALYRIDLSRTARPYTFRIEEETGRPVSSSARSTWWAVSPSAVQTMALTPAAWKR
mgnify:CR=1 FL=1